MAMGGDFPSNFRELLKQIQRRLSLLERAMDTKARQGQVDMLDKYVDRLLAGGEPDVPAGAIMSFGAAGVDFGGAWLYCEGQEVSRSDYSRLFDAVGTTYGAGNGSTTFNLPNLKGRLPVGHSPGDPELGSVADTGGARRHTLTTDEMPTHDHSASTGSAGSHSHSASTNSTGSHNHSIGGLGRIMTTNRTTNFGHRTSPTGTSGAAYVGAYAGDGTQSMGSENNTLSTGSHSHTVTVNSGGAHSHSVSVQNAGGGQSHNNMPPYIVLPYIIKT